MSSDWKDPLERDLDIEPGSGVLVRAGGNKSPSTRKGTQLGVPAPALLNDPALSSAFSVFLVHFSNYHVNSIMPGTLLHCSLKIYKHSGQCVAYSRCLLNIC